MRKSNLRHTLVAAMTLIFILACGGGSAPQPPAPAEKPPSNTFPTKASPVAPTDTVKPPATVTREPTATNKPTATKKPSPIPPSDAPLPPIPDFNDVLTFSIGSGGGQCPGVDETPNFVNLSQFGQAITTCFWLSEFDFTQPFQIILSRANGNGNRLVTPNIYLDSRDDVVWDEYEELPPGASSSWGYIDNGTLAVYNFNVWSPEQLSPGQWRFTISQKGGASFEYSSNFLVEEDNNRPYLTTLNARSNELLPFDRGMYVRPLSPKNNGKFDIRGTYFPPNTPVYVLLYSSGSSRNNFDMELINTQVVQSDRNGAIATELSGPFREGRIYLVVGISDPDTPIVDMYPGFEEYPYDRFEVAYPASNSFTSSSCPGAPPQRIAVNQLGYVCTKSDEVRLRNVPNLSGAVVDSLSVGTPFTVLDGPSCADNWSWWLIETDYGATGWVAEGGDGVDPYFICPLD